MKKTKFLFMLLVSITMLFNACDKDIESTVSTINTTDVNRMATIVIKGYANIDDTSFGDEQVPDGTKVILTALKSDFIAGAVGKLSFEFEFMGGEVIAEVPATDIGVTYTISPVDFESDQTQSPVVSSVNTIPMQYTGATVTIPGIIIGMKTFETIIYLGQTSPDFEEMVVISGSIEGEFNEELSGNEPLGKIISMSFYTDGWYEEISTNSDGTYSISVPKNETIHYNFSFIHNKNVWDNPTGTYIVKTYNYTGSGNFGPFGLNSSNNNIYVGAGTPVY